LVLTTGQYTQISLKTKDIRNLLLTSVEEKSAGRPNVFALEGISEASKNMNKCVLNDKNQP